MIGRFEAEGLLGALRDTGNEPLEPDEIQELAAALIRTRNEDEILSEMGDALPPATVAFLLRVDAVAKRGLTEKEVRLLPGEGEILARAELGRTTFHSFKRVLWKSLCDPKSEVYKAWFFAGAGVCARPQVHYDCRLFDVYRFRHWRKSACRIRDGTCHQVRH
jgi:hypothetical protein